MSRVIEAKFKIIAIKSKIGSPELWLGDEPLKLGADEQLKKWTLLPFTRFCIWVFETAYARWLERSARTPFSHPLKALVIIKMRLGEFLKYLSRYQRICQITNLLGNICHDIMALSSDFDRHFQVCNLSLRHNVHLLSNSRPRLWKIPPDVQLHTLERSYLVFRLTSARPMSIDRSCYKLSHNGNMVKDVLR